MSLSPIASDEGKQSSLKKHYGRRAFRRSFRHFVVGKGVKFFATLAALLILGRWMETTEYGAYIALRGLSEIARGITTIGVSTVLFRYLPELRAAGNNLAAYRLLRIGMLLRILAILLFFLLVLPFVDQIGITFNISDWVWLIPIALAIGALEVVVTTLSQSLESFFWQKEAQFSLASGNVLKVILFGVFVMLGELTLSNVILAEGVGLGFALSMLLLGLWTRWGKDEGRGDGDASWLRENLSRMVRFGAWAFALNFTRLLYGPGPNRLLIAHYLPIGELAVFGYASNLAQFGRRMMPSKLAATMLRPLLVARYSVSSDFSKISHLSNLVYRFNLSILVVPIGVLLLSGEYLLDLLTDGKYGAAAPILVFFLVILVSEGMRQLLALVAQAVERNDLMAASNLIQSASLLLAIPFITQFGVWAVLVSNFVGTLFANVVLMRLLRGAGFHYEFEWLPVARIAAYGISSVGLGWLLARYVDESALGNLWGLMMFLSCYTALYMFFPPFSAEERKMIGSVLRRRGGRNGAAKSGQDDVTP